MKKLYLLSVFIPMAIGIAFVSKANPHPFHTSGYIDVKLISGTTYQVTIVDYTIGDPQNSTSCGTNPDEDTLRIYFGDGNSQVLTRINRTGDSICTCRKANIYQTIYTYPGPGAYHIYYDAIGRTANISNMANSVNVDILVYNTLVIQPFGGDSLSMAISNPPVCSSGCTSECYYYNPHASSSTGDSLSYSLGSPLCMSGICPGYYNPGATIDLVTGKLSWCTPLNDGIYNFAIIITTYRNVIISSIEYHLPVDTEEVELEMIVQTDCPTGIDELANTNGFIIYPNPSTGMFTLQANSPQLMANSYVEVYNISGVKVYTQTFIQDEIQIDLSNNVSGLYYYRIITETGNLVSEGKFVIQK